MGKKGAVSGAQASKALAPATEPEEPKKKAKGHRQRGAGTVIVAPPPKTTEDGIVLAPHMRLPSVLVREYCQREKRIPPSYCNVNGKPNRMSLLLRDSKNADNDLTFCPVQSFDSPSLAREYAALLALHHFQPTLPLERKLPAPFAAAWLDMVQTSAAEKKNVSSERKREAKGSAESGGSTAALADNTSVISGKLAPAPVLGLRAASQFASRSAKEHSKRAEVSAAARKRAYFDAVRRANKPTSVFMNAQLRTIIESALGIVKIGDTSAPRQSVLFVTIEELRVALGLAGSTKSRRDSAAETLCPVKDVALDRQIDIANQIYTELTTKRHFHSSAVATALGALLVLREDQTLEDLGDITDQSSSLPRLFSCELSRTFDCMDQEFLNADEANAPDLGGTAKDMMTRQKENVFRGLLRDYSLEFLCLHMEEDDLPELYDGQTHLAPSGLTVLAPSTLKLGLQQQQQAERAPSCVSPPSSVSAPSSVSLASYLSNMYGFPPLEVERVLKSHLSGSAKLAEMLVLESFSISEALRSLTDAREGVPLSLQLPLLLLLSPSLLDAISSEEHGNALKTNQEHFSLDDMHALFASELDMMLSSCPHMSMHAIDPRTAGSEELAAVSDIIDVARRSDIWIMCSIPLRHLEAVKSKRTRSSSISVLKSLVLDVYIPSAFFMTRLLRVPEDTKLEFRYPVSCAAIPVVRSTEAAVGTGSALDPLNLLLPKISEELRSHALSMLGGCAMEQLKDIAIEALTREALTFDNSLSGAMSTMSISVARDSAGVEVNAPQPQPVLDNGVTSTRPKKSRQTSDQEVLRSHPFWRRAKVGVIGGNEGRSPQADEIPNKNTRSLLPAWACREEFLEYASKREAFIVTGETGCGKTTQIPQYLLEHYFDIGCDVRILVCQPRRLAAIGVAMRVAEERNVTIGDEVGYMVRGDCKAGSRTRLLFCTYGVLLRRLQQDRELAAVDFIIFDEVHERGLESDFALGLLMQVLQRRNNATRRAQQLKRTGEKMFPLKLILMSATIQTEKFVDYLSTHIKRDPFHTGGDRVPVLHIPGFTYPVQEYFKGDFERLVRSDAVDPGCGDVAAATRYGGYAKSGAIDYDLLVRLIIRLAYVDGHEHFTGDAAGSVLHPADGCVLVFMPGVSEIARVLRLVEEAVSDYRGAIKLKKLVPMALHGTLAPSDQSKVFRPAANGSIKLVVATNVAETSVTIPDVSVVIDTCKVKIMTYDAEKQLPSLAMMFASKDSLRQRRGRAGRVQAGRCFRMIPQKVYDSLPAHGVPDILRTPIERLVLQIVAMNPIDVGPEPAESIDAVGLVQRTLLLCPDPPSLDQIKYAVTSLQIMQAIRSSLSREGDEELLTPIGKHISNFPCPPIVGKLLLFGAILSCAAPISAIAACLTIGRDPFVASEKGTSGDPKASKMKIAEDMKLGNSDHLVLAEVVRRFRSVVSKRDQAKFCAANGVSLERMLEICKTQEELLQDLVHAQFVPSVKAGLSQDSQDGDFSYSSNGNASNAKVVCAALCAGLYPNICQVLQPPKRFVDTIGGVLERSANASELKYFIKLQADRDELLKSKLVSLMSSVDSACSESQKDEDDAFSAAVADESNVQGLQRVFLHPNNVCSPVGADSGPPSFNSRYLLYSSCQITFKAFVSEITEIRPYALLFFGRSVEVQYSTGVVEIDGWVRYCAPGRIVALVVALRRAVDALLSAKVEDPSIDIFSTPAIQALVALLTA